VQKLLAMLVCFGLVGAMSFTLVGCDKGKTDAQKKAELDAKSKDKAEVKIKAIDALDIGKKAEKKITVEIADPAPVDLTIKAWAKEKDDKDAKVLESKILGGTGTIKKGETKGELTITTADAPATVTEVSVDIPATDKTKEATTKVKTKIS
jgi:hypothetical protein